MLRNLYKTNRRPFNPGLSCRKRTGLPIVARTQRATRSINGAVAMRPTEAPITSKVLFQTGCLLDLLMGYGCRFYKLFQSVSTCQVCAPSIPLLLSPIRQNETTRKWLVL